MNDLIMVTDGVALLDGQTAAKIASLKKMQEELKNKEKELTDVLIAEMEAKNVIKIETDEMIISYIAPSDRETFDSKRFRADHADLYDDYVKMSPVKSSLRVKMR